MKTATRLTFSVISALLLTAGFAQAAEQFDPISSEARSAGTLAQCDLLDGPTGGGGSGPAPSCADEEDPNLN